MTGTPATDTPVCSPGDARRLLRAVWGIEGEVSPLAGERDLNFRVERGGEPVAVLKIVHPDETTDALEMQSAMLSHLASHAPSLPLPRVVRTREGQAFTGGAGGVGYRARLVSWLAGTPVGDRERTPSSLTAIGSTLGELSAAVRGFGHPGAHRRLAWDIRRASDARHRLSHVHEEGRPLLERALAHFEAARPRLDGMRHGVVHGDLNDWNVLLDDAGQVSGIIDVGDAAFAPVIADLAIAATYMAMGSRAPLDAIVTLVRACSAVFPIEEAEADVLVDLIRGRLCTSLSISAMRRSTATEAQAYWFVSERGGWELLSWLDRAADAHLRGAVRRACGWPGTARVSAFTEWRRTNPTAVQSPLRQPLERFKLQRLSWESPDDPVVRATAVADLEAADRAYEDLRDSRGFEVGVGLWGERRAIYTADAFRSRLLTGARRDTHLGLDLFAPAGTELIAPLDAVVVSATVCDRPQDYGGVILLEHRPAPGVCFRSLWGHLDPASIAQLTPGRALEGGTPFATLGDARVNGGWVPHLHLQLVLTDEGDADGIIGVGEADLLELWRDLYPDPSQFAGLPPEVLANEDTQPAREARARYFGPNLKLSYPSPLHIVRGRDVWLYDVRGRAYLDCYNNVAHVGHCHPRVVDAIGSQAAQLNTNTRYLHRMVGELAEGLLATFPSPLDTVYFTNSGSEATELALRIARTITGRLDTLVLDWAYHGNTQAAIDCSPYKYKRAGGTGRPQHIHEVPCPDPYRAPSAWAPHETGRRYARHVGQVIASGVRPAALIAETIPSCAGQVVIPRPFFEDAFASVRSVGGLCILDEVQVGFGRVGTAMWAFEEHGVVPDIVTLGKPMGNGHPVGAVVTTRALAQAFSNGMEYFNTFGGNPVSAAAALAVLGVLRDEKLVDNARHLGDMLLTGLRALQQRDQRIGEVRGRGLFVGIELVSDPSSREPATALARDVVSRCLEAGILAGTDGPYDNVLKLRPPMTVKAEHIDQLVETLGKALGASR